MFTLGIIAHNNIVAAPSATYIINYLNDGGTFTFTTDVSSNMELTNNGTGSNGLSYAGVGVELGATNELPLPVNYTLGSDTKQTATLGTGWVDNTGHSYTATLASSTLSDLSTTTSGTVLINFTVSAYSAGTIEGYSADGTYEVESTIESLTGVGFSGTVLINSVKELTTTGYLTYATDTEVVMLGNATDGGGTGLYTTPSTVDTGWTDNGDGTFTCDGTNAFLRCENILVQYDIYYGVMEVVERISGQVTNFYNGSEGSVYYTTTGVKEDTFTHINIGAGNTAYIYSRGFVGTVRPISITQILPNSTTYTLPVSDTYRWAYVNENAFSTADLTAIEGNPNKIVEFALDNANSDLTATQGANDKFFGFRDDDAVSPERVYDALNAGEYADISNYASTVRTNVDQSPYGIQWTCATLDSIGVPTAYVDTTIQFYGNENIDTQWNPSLESAFWIEEIIDNVVYQHKYDGTNLTTYTDNVAGTPSAHSPENASYLMGKGAYPKVTADALSSYTLKHFLVDVDGYASYSQSARYTVLSAI